MGKHEQQIVELAINILDSQLREKGDALTSSETVKRFLRLNVELLGHEVFGVLFLDNRHTLIEYREMFRGTIDAACVHVREVLKEALELNAAAVIFVHNHPSGNPKPSQADRRLTEQLKEALALVEIRVLDHFVVGHGNITSFAERGLL